MVEVSVTIRVMYVIISLCPPSGKVPYYLPYMTKTRSESRGTYNVPQCPPATISSTSVSFIDSFRCCVLNRSDRYSPLQALIPQFGPICSTSGLATMFGTHCWLWPSWEAWHDSLQAGHSCYGSISGESYLDSSRRRKASVSIGYHHTRRLSPIVKLTRPVEGTIHHSLKHIMVTSGYFLTSPGTGNWYRTLYGTVCRTVGYW